MKIIAGNSNRDLAEKIAEHCFTDIVPTLKLLQMANVV